MNASAREPRCIICGEKRNGLDVREDFILKNYRKLVHSIRHITGKTELNKRNYRLVVCKQCFVKYGKLRNSYQKRQIAYLALGVVFAAVLLGFSRNPLSLVYGGGVAVFMYLLAQLSYMPAVNLPVIGSTKAGVQRRSERFIRAN